MIYHFNFLFLHKFLLEWNNYFLRKAFRRLGSCLVNDLAFNQIKHYQQPPTENRQFTNFCDFLWAWSVPGLSGR